MLGSTEGRPRAASGPKWALGPGLPALSGSSAGTHGEPFRPQRRPPWVAGFRSTGEIPAEHPRPREPRGARSIRAHESIPAMSPPPHPSRKQRQTRRFPRRRRGESGPLNGPARQPVNVRLAQNKSRPQGAAAGPALPNPAHRRRSPAPLRPCLEARGWLGERAWALVGGGGVTRTPSSPFQRRLLGRLSLLPQTLAVAGSQLYVLPCLQCPPLPSSSRRFSRALLSCLLRRRRHPPPW